MPPIAKPGQDDSQDRLRAAKACQRCNARRAGFEHDCTLRQSKRGTYPRKKAKHHQTLSTVEADNDPDSSRLSETLATPEGLSQRELTTWPRDRETNRRSDKSPNMFPPPPPPPSTRPWTPTSMRERPSPPFVTQNDPTPPTSHVQWQYPSEDRLATLAMLAASPGYRAMEVPPEPRTTAGAGNNRIDLASPESTMSRNSGSSYREISWTAMFDHFLNGRKTEGTDMVDKCSITYLGESFPLAMVLQDLTDNGAPRLHHAGPPLQGESTPTAANPPDLQHPSHMADEDIAFLQAKDAFAYPDDKTLTALVATFLERVYPLYPVVSLQEFLMQYKTRTIPFILLNAICFVAATYCPLAALHQGGFTGRREARFSFYKKAKAIFDTGYECNKIAILQSSILLTFWGGGPNNYWNFYSWIGTSVTIAETLGMHRSLAATNMSKQDRSLLKRLWWILIIRDSFCGALVGRPFRIGMEHSDTEMLTPEDFQHDEPCLSVEKHPYRFLYGEYQIHMASLALILREIVITRFGPKKKSQTRAELNSMLQSWRQTLPRELSWSDHASKKLNVFATSLAMIYNHHVILINFGFRRDNSAQDASEAEATTLQAASQEAARVISEFACFIVTRSLVLTVPHEAFSALFVAEVVFYTQVKSAQAMVAQVGRMSLNNCQMVLHNAKEAWDPAPWVMQLFENLMSTSKDATTASDGHDHSRSDTHVNATSNDFIDIFGMGGPTDGVAIGGDFNALQSNNLLSTFLQMPNEMDGFAGLDFLGLSGDFGDVMQAGSRQ
ncbi:hypothetical protein LTS14_010898 [Recurvomyces mirabilis]|uniref:uncharacterized protein n=1 Tax=Recurvomyces mirabilis TaxID=574656 RepID=UPI002DE02E28|nr:hypothetical protein LTS14_010898 [Recurvomyces mirabilis]